MTVSSTVIRVSYTGDGASVNFTVPYLFYANTDLLVVLGGVPQSSGYTVSGAGNPLGGTVTFTTAPAASVNVQIILNVPLTQIVNLVDGTAFPSATLNQENDRAIQASLRLNDLVTRAIRAPDGPDVTPSMVLPSATARASTYLGFDSNGNPISVAPPTGITTALLQQPATNKQFANGGANIQRVNDRLMVGDAGINDGNLPNVAQDWLSAFQTSTAYGNSPISSGTLLGCQMACLANHLVGGLGGAAIFGAESINQGAGGGDIIVTNSFAINNNPAGVTAAWAWYGEAWRTNNTTGQTVNMEIDIVQQGQLAQAQPYQQSPQEATCFITAAGAGRFIAVTLATGTPGIVTWTNHGLSPNAPVWLSATYIGGTLPAAVTTGTQYYVKTVLSANTFSISATPGGAAIAFASNSTGTIAAANQYPATCAWNIGANPVPFDKGIIFGADSIAGTNGNDSNFGYAINLAKGHLLQWWAPGGVPTGSVTSNGTTTANSTALQFGEGYALMLAQNGLPHTYFRGTAAAVNYLNLYHASTGNAVAITAGGSDPNIDITFIPQGTGSVKFGTFTATTFAQTGYISIKDSGGTVRRLMVG